MHKSRIGTIVIDCQTEDLEEAARFWAAALGRPARKPDDPASAHYRTLETSGDEITMLLQAVQHPSRVHIDIETNDVEAEVRRLEALGATRIARVKSWWVMEAPTGHRFCVVRPQRAGFEENARAWSGTGEAKDEC